jgi:hypothetical protein
MSKKKTHKSAPVVIEFTFIEKSNGNIVIQYQGTDPRTHAIGDAVIEAIAAFEGREIRPSKICPCQN